MVRDVRYLVAKRQISCYFFKVPDKSFLAMKGLRFFAALYLVEGYPHAVPLLIVCFYRIMFEFH